MLTKDNMQRSGMKYIKDLKSDPNPPKLYGKFIELVIVQDVCWTIKM